MSGLLSIPPRTTVEPLRTPLLLGLLALILLVCGRLEQPPPAAAFNPLKPLCSSPGQPVTGAACKLVQGAGKLAGAGKKLATGHVGGAVKTAAGVGAGIVGGVGQAAFSAGLSAVGSWVLGGARAALRLTGQVIQKSTRPQLHTTWFSTTYWRIGGIAALLTLPFLFAATIQALLRSDLSVLLRAALGYLPLSLLAVSVAAPLTMLLLSATDAMSAVVSSAAGGASAKFLSRLSLMSGAVSVLTSSPFVSFFVGIMIVAGAIVLWVEMLMREAAIYIVVLMLPLVFAALVWPARRVWAIRALELLVALVLSKFVVVAVLSLGAAALGHDPGGGASGLLLGLVLVILAAFAPWALMRLLPMAELAGAAAGHLRGELSQLRAPRMLEEAVAGGGGEWLRGLPAMMRRQAESIGGGGGGPTGSGARSEVEKLGADEDGRSAEEASDEVLADELAAAAGGGGEGLRDGDGAGLGAEDPDGAPSGLGLGAPPGAAEGSGAARSGAGAGSPPAAPAGAGSSRPGEGPRGGYTSPAYEVTDTLLLGPQEAPPASPARGGAGSGPADDPDPLPSPQEAPEGSL